MHARGAVVLVLLLVLGSPVRATEGGDAECTTLVASLYADNLIVQLVTTGAYGVMLGLDEPGRGAGAALLVRPTDCGTNGALQQVGRLTQQSADPNLVSLLPSMPTLP